MDQEILGCLRDWQQAPAERLHAILQRHPSAVDMSYTGTGKTYVAMAVAVAMRLPTLCVVPKISVTTWKRVAAEFNEGISVVGYEKLRTGNSGYGRWENQANVELGRQVYFTCQCCQRRVDPVNPDRCYTHHLGIHCLETKKSTVNYGAFKFHSEVKAIIFDEAHRCGGIDSLNAELLLAARRQQIKTLCLSATLATDPLKMRALGYALDLHNDKTDQIYLKPVGFGMNYKAQQMRRPSFFRWATQHGCRKIPPVPGIRWAVSAERQQQIMASIRAQIIPDRGVQITTDEIPNFPKRDVTAELYDLEENEQINRLYDQMRSALESLDGRSALDKSPDHPLTKILRARQRIELFKVPIAVELTLDAIEKGLSVGIFVNFSQTIDELASRLKCREIIDGRPEHAGTRQAVIDRFQRDESRLVILNSEAGGIAVSLHDVRGEFPRIGFVFPGLSAVTFKQLLGRFQRDGGRSRSHYRVILAANTVEEKIKRQLDQKLANLDALTDGDLVPV